MQQQSKWRPYILTIIGAACWGVIGLFIQPLYDRGFTAWDVVTIRGVLTFIFNYFYVGIKPEIFENKMARSHLFCGCRNFKHGIFQLFIF